MGREGRIQGRRGDKYFHRLSRWKLDNSKMFSDFKTLLIHVPRKEGGEGGKEGKGKERKEKMKKGFKNIEL